MSCVQLYLCHTARRILLWLHSASSPGPQTILWEQSIQKITGIHMVSGMLHQNKQTNQLTCPAFEHSSAQQSQHAVSGHGQCITGFLTSKKHWSMHMLIDDNNRYSQAHTAGVTTDQLLWPGMLARDGDQAAPSNQQLAPA